MTEENFNIHHAVRESVGLFVGVAGGTGSGKTFSLMRMAAGIVGPGKRFGVVDTENKRASHYADEFDFDVIDLSSPFSSERYEGAVRQLFAKEYGAIIVDSASHEHDGHGGYLDSQTEDLEARVKRYMEKYPTAKEWDARDKLTPSSWVAPKRNRKRMMQTLLSCSSTVPILFGFRAEEKVFVSKDGKLVARQHPEWEPICGKSMPFEMTVFFMLHSDKPGYIHKAIKIPAKFKDIFPMDKIIDESCGARISAWAKGGTSKAPTTEPTVNQSGQTDLLTPDNKAKKRLEMLISQEGIDREGFKEWLYSMKMIGLKDGKPSLSTMTEGCAKGLADKEKWNEAMQKFNSYIDQKNAGQAA